MNRGTVCEISCQHYEDKPAVPKKVYGCNIDGSWTPELPFCVRAGSGQIKFLFYLKFVFKTNRPVTNFQYDFIHKYEAVYYV